MELKKYRKKYLAVTWAQEGTPVHRELLRNLTAYMLHLGGEVWAIPGRYHTPDGDYYERYYGDDKKRSELIYDEAIQPYLLPEEAEDFRLGEHLVVFGGMTIRPTTKRPLSSLAALGRAKSVVVGHPRQHFQVLASGGKMPKVLASTGAITMPHYTKSLVGRMAKEHHILGAVILEEDEGYFHIRQINASPDGSFQDLWNFVSDGTVTERPAASVRVSDPHAEKPDPDAWSSMLALINDLRPKTLVTEDILDFMSRNHHARNLLNFRVKMGTRTIEEDLNAAAHGLLDLAAVPSVETVHVVASNHHDAFDKWLESTTPHEDPLNAHTWVKMWQLKMTHGGMAFALWWRANILLRNSGKVKFLSREDELWIEGVANHFHGDNGVNGMRAAPSMWTRCGFKLNVGHSHSPLVLDNLFCGGMMGNLRQGYNLPPSTWLQSVIITYPGGKRTLAHYINGKFTTLVRKSQELSEAA